MTESQTPKKRRNIGWDTGISSIGAVYVDGDGCLRCVLDGRKAETIHAHFQFDKTVHYCGRKAGDAKAGAGVSPFVRL